MAPAKKGKIMMYSPAEIDALAGIVVFLAKVSYKFLVVFFLWRIARYTKKIANKEG